MKHTPSVMRLHLSCRICIAEMNLDINILRIFDDYLKEMSAKNGESELKTGIDYFEKQFIDFRKEIDQLRHEFHVLKMQFGAYSKTKKPLDEIASEIGNYAEIEKRYITFRKAFAKLKNDFGDFEGKWLD